MGIKTFNFPLLFKQLPSSDAAVSGCMGYKTI